MKNKIQIFSIIVVVSFLCSCTNYEKRETKYSNGQTEECYTVKEIEGGSFIKDGEYCKYYSNGQIKIQGDYRDGKREGCWKGWFENGQLRYSWHYKKDIFSGHNELWAENGQKIFEGTFLNGKRNEKVISWYKNGQKEAEGVYKNGIKNGVFKNWDIAGKLLSTFTYEDGREINLPMTYKNKKTKEKITLNPDDTFIFTHYKYNGWGIFASKKLTVDKGNFVINGSNFSLKGALELKYDIFNKDTLRLKRNSSYFIFLRVKSK